MFIITVIPITKGIFKDTLSYFSGQALEKGSLINVPMRNRNVPALVVECLDAEAMKSDIKSLTFTTKKIGKTTSQKILLPAFLHSAELTAEYYVSPRGAVLNRLIPTSVLSTLGETKKTKTKKIKVEVENKTEDENKNETINNEKISEEKKELRSAPEKNIIQMSDEDRLGTYKSLVRENFARKNSVMIVLPTTEETKQMHELLKKGIEHRIHILHSNLTTKVQGEQWNEIMESELPVLIVTTALFVGIPREDIKTIIIEHESSRAYKPSFPPFIDLRFFIEKYAVARGARLIMGDVLLRIETLVRHSTGELIELFPLKFRLQNGVEKILVDMKKAEGEFESGGGDGTRIVEGEKGLPTVIMPTGSPRDEKNKKKFRILSEELESMIEYALQKKQGIFLYCQRRGLAPSVICGDCSTTVLCKNCTAPVVLHTNTKKERFFMCHHCGDRRSAEEHCANCDSWKLTSLGIGIDTISDAVKKMIPIKKLGDNAPIFQMDRDTITTEKQALTTIKKFTESIPETGAILIGTEMALAYLPETENVAVVSLDSLFALPDFRINERVMHTLITLLTKAKKYFLVQSRLIEQPVLEQAIQGNLSDFFNREKDVRRQIGYPPYSLFIKITLDGPREQINDQMNLLKEKIIALNNEAKGDAEAEENHHVTGPATNKKETKLEPYVFPAFISTIKGNQRLHMLLRIPTDKWPHQKLLDILSCLPPQFIIKIDPESLL